MTKSMTPEQIAEFWADVAHIRAEQGDPHVEWLGAELARCEQELARLIKVRNDAYSRQQHGTVAAVRDCVLWVKRYGEQIELALKRREFTVSERAACVETK